MAKSYSILSFCVFIWAINYIARQILLQEFPPLFLSAFSLTIVSGLFLFAAFLSKSFVKLTGKEVLLLLLSALIGLIANQILLFNGLRHTTATNASLIFTLSPMMTAGLAAAFLKEKITLRMLIGSLVAFFGIIIALNLKGITVSSGDLLMFGAVFTFSINLILIRILSRRLSPFMITVYSFTLSGAIFDPWVLSNQRIDWSHSIWIWGLAFVTVIVAQGLANVLWNKGMETVGAARSAIVLNLQPLMTMLLDLIIFKHAVTPHQMMGASLVFVGVLLGTLQKGLFYKKTESL
ncbi:DMT family transporter [Paenibacillus sp. GP183]|uniref:DMT family transporter n=1 Tax=Paenibacillus sp. GP183 TaxID=1882751 RepID=UPI000898BFF6|nr:DMT family transporter [Paenibacillus sp. GP183]SEC08774.1 Permease of the drug/metabolite transporter (DMT) superfamily [Paenibacillus sp. GP183]